MCTLGWRFLSCYWPRLAQRHQIAVSQSRAHRCGACRDQCSQSFLTSQPAPRSSQRPQRPRHYPPLQAPECSLEQLPHRSQSQRQVAYRPALYRQRVAGSIISGLRRLARARRSGSGARVCGCERAGHRVGFRTLFFFKKRFAF
jgi:hypothetical protein